ncbi:hypothetical protein ACJX0J_025507, partial [Zea mays]
YIGHYKILFFSFFFYLSRWIVYFFMIDHAGKWQATSKIVDAHELCQGYILPDWPAARVIVFVGQGLLIM